MDQRELNDNVGRAQDTSSKRGDHFSRTFIRNDLTALRRCRDSLTKAEKETFRARYGTMDTLIDVPVNEQAIRASIGFFDPRLRCFILPHLDLAFTVEEYHHLTNATWIPEGPEPYMPDLDKLAAKGDALKPRLQQLGNGILHAHMVGALCTENKKAYLDWSRMFQNMGAGWEKVLTSATRINFFALGLFGLVLFPSVPDKVESRVVELVISQTKSPSRNIMPMVVAETLRACVYMRHNKKAVFKCCTQLYTMWIYSHLTFEKDMNCGSQYDIMTDHILKFKDEGRRDWDEEAWHNRFTSIEDREIVWKAPWLTGLKRYLAPPTGQFWIPLFGVYGAISYSPCMAMKQLGGEQDKPHMYAKDNWNVEYDQKSKNSADLRLMKETWKACERIDVWPGEYTEAYKAWRQEWVKNKEMPRKPRRTIYRELAEVKVTARRLEQQSIGFKARAEKLEFMLREEKHNVQRSRVREAEIDSLYEEMRVLCNDMEEEKDWAELRLEFKREDCSRLREGKERLQVEVGSLTSYLERYRKQLMKYRKERDELRKELAQSQMETRVAQEEAVGFKRKWAEEGEKRRQLEEVIAQSDAQEFEYKGMLDVFKIVNIAQELRRKAYRESRAGAGGLESLAFLIGQNPEIQAILNQQKWLVHYVNQLKKDFDAVAGRAKQDRDLGSSNFQEHWVEAEEYIEKVYKDSLGDAI